MGSPREPDWLQHAGLTLEEYLALTNRFPAFHSETERIERELRGPDQIAAYLSAIRWAQELETNSPRQLNNPSPCDRTDGIERKIAPKPPSTPHPWRFSLRKLFLLATILAILAALLRYWYKHSGLFT